VLLLGRIYFGNGELILVTHAGLRLVSPCYSQVGSKEDFLLYLIEDIDYKSCNNLSKNLPIPLYLEFMQL
jgi:hypothetical protein